MSKYVVGVDFGTLSARALVLEIGSNQELCSAVMDYPHGVMDEYLPNGTPLKSDWALQHPQDYLDCLKFIIPESLRLSRVSPSDVIGIGIDFTASTVIPVDKDGLPLCMHSEYADNPHAWPKLWKHHGAQAEANRMTEVANERGESFLRRYGGKVSSEWMLPKIWQVLNEAPEIYAAADRFIEAGDWIVFQLTGQERRSSSMAGYKAFWHKDEGYPSREYFKALDPRLENVIEEKLPGKLYPVGDKAGEITLKASAITGLLPGTTVAVANIDAHASLPAAKIVSPGSMLVILGTSACHIMIGNRECEIPGMCGVVADGVIPGYPGYEAGQNCMGDHFAWVVKNCCPPAYHEAAADKGLNIHEYLTSLAQQQKPGATGLIALDWWNGNRSVLVDANLSGLILGMTLATKPEDIYRALIEAVAYGTRMIIETFEKNGVKINALYAGGGISKKNPLVMQIFSDVLNRQIHIAASAQAPAMGAAMFGAVAAGSARGGYDAIENAAAEMGKLDEHFYRPIPENVAIYNRLYAEYVALHDHFGRGANDVMKRLRLIREEQR